PDQRPGHVAGERRDAEQADLRRRPGQRVHLDVEPDPDELRPEGRDERSRPGQPEAARDAEGRDVDRDAAEAPRHPPTLAAPQESAPATASSSMSRPSASSASSIVSGGSSRTTLPYVPAVSTITPRSSAPRAIADIVSAPSGSFVSRSPTSSIAHIAPR